MAKNQYLLSKRNSRSTDNCHKRHRICCSRIGVSTKISCKNVQLEPGSVRTREISPGGRHPRKRQQHANIERAVARLVVVAVRNIELSLKIKEKDLICTSSRIARRSAHAAFAENPAYLVVSNRAVLRLIPQPKARVLQCIHSCSTGPEDSDIENQASSSSGST